MSESNTPLTDARRDDARISCDDSCCEVFVEHNGVPCEVVTLEFARSLERENARLILENRNLLEALQWLHDEIDTHFFCGTETMSRSMQDAYNEAMELLSNLAGD